MRFQNDSLSRIGRQRPVVAAAKDRNVMSDILGATGKLTPILFWMSSGKNLRSSRSGRQPSGAALLPLQNSIGATKFLASVKCSLHRDGELSGFPDQAICVRSRGAVAGPSI
jgi:hypothetical protein